MLPVAKQSIHTDIHKQKRIDDQKHRMLLHTKTLERKLTIAILSIDAAPHTDVKKDKLWTWLVDPLVSFYWAYFLRPYSRTSVFSQKKMEEKNQAIQEGEPNNTHITNYTSPGQDPLFGNGRRTDFHRIWVWSTMNRRRSNRYSSDSDRSSRAGEGWTVWLQQQL